MAELILREEPRQAQYFTESLTERIGLDMILVPGGEFQMGSPDDEPERENDESPQHLVQVPAFFMGRYPVTQAQWSVVAETFPQVNRELAANPSEFDGDDRPVEKVSWFDAVEFCDRLSKHTGRPYRLPSEAEWEYACRAGTDTPFYYGRTLTPELANYYHEDSYNNGPTGESPGETTPVGKYLPNAFGLCDMHGNVYEWCADHWHSSYESAPDNGSAWIDETAEEEGYRVLRGGAWGISPQYCRSACRGTYDPREAFNYIGFRVVSVAPRALP